MKDSRHLSLWASTFALLCFAGHSEVSSSLVVQMTFEEVATQAKVIVLGRVSKIPELAVYDSTTHHLYPRNVVHVVQYLKSKRSAPDIVVLPFGGEVMKDDGTSSNEAVTYGGEPQLPPVGTEVLLFLIPFGGTEAHMIYSASHGIVRVQEGEKSEEGFVNLLIRNPDLLSPASAARLQEMHPAPDEPKQAVVERVPLSALKATVDKALNLKRKPPQSGQGPKSP